jgi:hypothetical protein
MSFDTMSAALLNDLSKCMSDARYVTRQDNVFVTNGAVKSAVLSKAEVASLRTRGRAWIRSPTRERKQESCNNRVLTVAAVLNDVLLICKTSALMLSPNAEMLALKERSRRESIQSLQDFKETREATSERTLTATLGGKTVAEFDRIARILTKRGRSVHPDEM